MPLRQILQKKPTQTKSSQGAVKEKIIAPGGRVNGQ